ncbi:DNA mismatch repair endonuclease MutL [Tuanshanicoccus lijuaniae]|uniref:DNA mismatch repair endonuclease MutL n=1 Tax=Aerococcaceae bacterium zg-1292 TaxID=2774330 RepID=UPI001BD8F45B|nr:DNA mismatch repair endonuclease MutL [Aerococcaceae bacterium zg-A91]MBS4457698.1 DNA mismatch repair endonuclease MutL [Aerococcaceae bacterium zg-BR33]
MGKIKQMSEHLANQIAAGEVVERPSSVVKELVENAIDAGSTTIRIELVEAGIQSIRISDDGSGMDETDLSMAILPHATSKIYDIHDLFRIQSLGFRGEALASIASVSKMTIESTVNNHNNPATQGYFIKVAGSQVIEKGVTPPKPGTVITVDSLFYNTPARLKHLSSLKTELRHSLNFVQQIALAYPHIRFSLVNDQSTLFSTYGTGDLRQTIANVYQAGLARQLIAIEASDNDFHLTGYISPPQLTRTSKHYIHWLINGRVVQSFVLTQMLLKAYGRQLMIGRYPISVIDITLDPQLVDVNVHPTKQTVRLSKESELNTLLYEAVQQVLLQINPVPTFEPSDLGMTFGSKSAVEEPIPLDLSAAPERVENKVEKIDTETPPQIDSKREATKLPVIQEEIEPINRSEQQLPQLNVQSKTITPSNKPEENVEKTSHLVASESKQQHSEQVFPINHNKVPFYDLRYVGQIHGTYLIAESEQGFYLIDQHAAQERIRYENLMKTDVATYEQQYVLMPFVFTFSASDAAQVEELLPTFSQLGLELSSFGPCTYQMDSYPNWLETDEVEKTVYDLVELLRENPDLTVNQLREKSIIMQSCRGAIKANHYLNDVQARALIQDMALLDDPYHCPHGRPVFVEFNQKTLEKLFKRIQDSHQGGHQL